MFQDVCPAVLTKLCVTFFSFCLPFCFLGCVLRDDAEYADKLSALYKIFTYFVNFAVAGHVEII